MIPFLVDFNFLIYSNFDVNYAGAAIRMCIPNMVTSLFDFEKKISTHSYLTSLNKFRQFRRIYNF